MAPHLTGENREKHPLSGQSSSLLGLVSTFYQPAAVNKTFPPQKKSSEAVHPHVRNCTPASAQSSHSSLIKTLDVGATNKRVTGKNVLKTTHPRGCKRMQAIHRRRWTRPPVERRAILTDPLVQIQQTTGCLASPVNRLASVMMISARKKC